jgi:hypothetical protein
MRTPWQLLDLEVGARDEPPRAFIFAHRATFLDTSRCLSQIEARLATSHETA